MRYLLIIDREYTRNRQGYFQWQSICQNQYWRCLLGFFFFLIFFWPLLGGPPPSGGSLFFFFFFIWGTCPDTPFPGGDLRQNRIWQYGGNQCFFAQRPTSQIAALTLFARYRKGYAAVFYSALQISDGLACFLGLGSGAFLGHLYPSWLRILRGAKGLAKLCWGSFPPGGGRGGMIRGGIIFFFFPSLGLIFAGHLASVSLRFWR